MFMENYLSGRLYDGIQREETAVMGGSSHSYMRTCEHRLKKEQQGGKIPREKKEVSQKATGEQAVRRMPDLYGYQ